MGPQHAPRHYKYSVLSTPRQYKYNGISVHEHPDDTNTTNIVGNLGSTCPGSICHEHKCAKGSLVDLACPTARQPAQPAHGRPRDKYLPWVGEVATDVLPAGKAPCGAQPSRAKRGPSREARYSPAREARSAATVGGGTRRRRRPPPKAAPELREGFRVKLGCDQAKNEKTAAD